LVRAAEQDSDEAVALLIELGFDVNARSRTAPLHEAATRGNVPVIKLLLDHGADPNIRDTGYAPPRRDGPSITTNPGPNSCSKHTSNPPRPSGLRMVKSRRPSRERRCGS